jgi:hypothetical protein
MAPCVPDDSLCVDSLEMNNNSSVALVRERTKPTKRPPLVNEVSAKVLWMEGVAWSARRIPTAVLSDF